MKHCWLRFRFHKWKYVGLDDLTIGPSLIDKICEVCGKVVYSEE